MDEEQDNEKHQQLLKRDTLEGLELMPTYLKISQILLLRYDEFVDLVAKFNQTLKSFTDDQPDFIEFSIEPESDTTMFWKLFIRIKCSRVSQILFTSLSSIFFSLLDFKNGSTCIQ
jgi:hypothetical protein